LFLLLHCKTFKLRIFTKNLQHIRCMCTYASCPSKEIQHKIHQVLRVLPLEKRPKCFGLGNVLPAKRIDEEKRKPACSRPFHHLVAKVIKLAVEGFSLNPGGIRSQERFQLCISIAILFDVKCAKPDSSPRFLNEPATHGLVPKGIPIDVS